MWYGKHKPDGRPSSFHYLPLDCEISMECITEGKWARAHLQTSISHLHLNREGKITNGSIGVVAWLYDT